MKEKWMRAASPASVTQAAHRWTKKPEKGAEYLNSAAGLA